MLLNRDGAIHKPILKETTRTDENRLCVENSELYKLSVQLSNQGIVSFLLVWGCCRHSRCGGIRSLASFPAITVVESGQLLRVGSLIIRSIVPNKILLHTTDSLAKNNYIPSARRNPILQPNKCSWEYRIDRLSVVSRDTPSQDKSGVRPGMGISNTNLFMKLNQY